MEKLSNAIDMFIKFSNMEMQNENVKTEIENWTKPFIERLYDKAIAAPTSPQDDEVIINFLANTKIPQKDGQPTIVVSITGNTPQITNWAQKEFKKVQRNYINKVKQMAAKATAPFDADAKVQRTYSF